jgi:thiol:disulfide interchange protein/DsbC/DsbD-like thiol-disulfide interchange protein
MMIVLARLLAACTLSLVLMASAGAADARFDSEELSIALVSEQTALVPGATQRVGLLIEHQPHWHTYWRNPGDSGIPTKLRWSLPDGISAGAVAWPHPQRFDLSGIANFGYGDRVLLPIPITLDAAFSASAATLAVTVDWLVCQEECIPGRASLELTLPVAAQSQPDSRHQDDFRAALARVPVLVDWKANVQIDEQQALVEVALPADFPTGAMPDLFPLQIEVLSNTVPSGRAVHAGVLHWPSTRSEYMQSVPDSLDLVLVSGEPPHSRAWQLRANVVDLSAATAAIAAPASGESAAGDSGAPMSVALALVFALLGGAILNLMPCVFPVLTLKALALRGDISGVRHGLLYALGCVSAFLSLAAALLALRAAGEVLGWGFQLQSPWLIGALVYLFFAMGLSLSGVFSFGERWMGVGQSLTEGESDRAAFFTGVLAAVVASPCTAPFMGAAMGFALTQSAPVALLIFATLGFGLALPFLLLCLMPGLAQRLPRPGAWMDRLKQVLAFPLYLSAVWLLWVYGEQLGALAMARLAGGAVFLAFALWLLGLASSGKWLRGVAVAVSLAAVGYALYAGASQSAAPGESALLAGHERFSEARLAELRKAGTPVLVNMTAAWCITCLANERVALSTDAVRERMSALDVAYLKGDWTRRDDAITRYLAQYGRSGVPLYVLYPSDGSPPQVLPQLLTADVVLAALDAAVRHKP